MVALVLFSGFQDYFVYGHGDVLVDKVWFLDVDVERSLYTWISTLLLAVASYLLILIGLDRFDDDQPFAYHWLFLGAVFLGLSADEALSVHEAISGVLSEQAPGHGIHYFAWAAPALVLALIGLVLYVPMLLSLSVRDRMWLLAAAALFLSGAVGLEMVAGVAVEAYGLGSFRYHVLANIEEALEGLGVLILIYRALGILGYAPEHRARSYRSDRRIA
jgi:hypothetical protein